MCLDCYPGKLVTACHSWQFFSQEWENIWVICSYLGTIDGYMVLGSTFDRLTKRVWHRILQKIIPEWEACHLLLENSLVCMVTISAYIVK